MVFGASIHGQLAHLFGWNHQNSIVGVLQAHHVLSDPGQFHRHKSKEPSDTSLGVNDQVALPQTFDGGSRAPLAAGAQARDNAKKLSVADQVEEAIGADPDLIDVGLVLRVPAGATAVTR